MWLVATLLGSISLELWKQAQVFFLDLINGFLYFLKNGISGYENRN